MPVYEYECHGCNARLERRQRFDEAPLTECPSCGSRLRRVLYPVPIVYKGSGFYTTDHGSRPSGDS